MYIVKENFFGEKKKFYNLELYIYMMKISGNENAKTERDTNSIHIQFRGRFIYKKGDGENWKRRKRNRESFWVTDQKRIFGAHSFCRIANSQNALACARMAWDWCICFCCWGTP